MGTVTPLFRKPLAVAIAGSEIPAGSVVAMGSDERAHAAVEQASAERAAMLRTAMRALEQAAHSEECFARLLRFPVEDEHLIGARAQLRADVDANLAAAVKQIAQLAPVPEWGGAA